MSAFFVTRTGSYAYDEVNRLTGVTDPDGETWELVHDLLDLREIRHPNGITTRISYDPARQTETVRHETAGGDPRLAIDYLAYDGADNSTDQTVTYETRTVDHGFTYDELGRLASSTISELPDVMTFDSDVTLDDANRLADDGRFTFEYDDEGRLTSRVDPVSSVTELYEYHAENRLLRYAQVLDDGGDPLTLLDAAYAYDPTGRRIYRNVNGVITRYSYDAAVVLQDLDRRGVPIRAYTRAGRRARILSVTSRVAPREAYYHTDRLGSVIGLTGSDASVIQEYVYDAFGRILEESDAPIAQPFTFTGRALDRESGLYYFRARYYDPETGRFLTEEPLGLAGGDLTLYAYVWNNPVNLIDPTGRDPRSPRPLPKNWLPNWDPGGSRPPPQNNRTPARPLPPNYTPNWDPDPPPGDSPGPLPPDYIPPWDPSDPDGSPSPTPLDPDHIPPWDPDPAPVDPGYLPPWNPDC